MSWMTRLLDRVSGARAGAAQAFDAPLAPAERLAVIGDVHGCYDQLVEMLSALGEADPPPGRLVFTGDIVDRGEHSAKVVALLYTIQERLGSRMVLLRGNHEEMMLRFIDDPEQSRRWLRFGGLQTLASYGIGAVTEHSGPQEAGRARDALAAALGPDHLAWLRGLPNRFTSGNVTVVHAAADPHLPIAEQSDEVLAWGHRDFFTVPRGDGQWVVHGHSVVEAVEARAGRIGVDTGAFATGVLSGALIDPGRMTPLSVRV